MTSVVCKEACQLLRTCKGRNGECFGQTTDTHPWLWRVPSYLLAPEGVGLIMWGFCKMRILSRRA